MSVGDESRREPESARDAASDDAIAAAATVAESGVGEVDDDAGDGVRDDDPVARIAQLEAALHEKQEDWLRERAELENFKKRMQREKAEALRYAQEPLLRELLAVVDNLERALAHAQSGAESVAEGVQLVLKSLLDTLARHGVEPVDARGEMFDPSLHEAIGQSNQPEAAPGAVTEQHQVGYTLHTRLLRPALVTVNARSESQGASGSEATQEPPQSVRR